MRTALALLLLVAGAGWPRQAHAQPGRVLVVVNAASADSVRIGEHYGKARQIPPDQILRLEGLPAEPPDGIDRRVFEQAISAPIAAWLARHQAQDRIHFIVLTRGIPLRIHGGADESAASVDSELALLYLRLTGVRVGAAGPFPNPYFLGDRPLTDARRFSRDAHPLYLVTRLDGFTVNDVLALIDRGITPSRTGRVVLDGKSSWNDRGNGWLLSAARRLKELGLGDDRVVFNESADVITDQVDVLGYYSWGSNDPAITRRRFNLRFVPGAIGGMFVSTDGRTFTEPPEGWTLPRWDNKAAWHAGTPQSLSGDLIREGITGVSGHVAEPLLGNTIRPDILFPAYVSGFTLAEAYYLAMPSLSWMTVVVGDPLVAPFGDAPAALQPETIDQVTELPALFSQRRLASLEAPGLSEEVRRLMLRVESRSARPDTRALRSALEELTGLAPNLLLAQLRLAMILESEGEVDAAIARYRTVLTHAPRSAAALNNLAYLLGTRKGNLKEALPLARQAMEIEPASAAIADTLGWLHFMSGDAKTAAQLIEKAVRAPDAAGEIWLHLAQVRAALGDQAGAREALARAVELDPALANRPDAQKLR